MSHPARRAWRSLLIGLAVLTCLLAAAGKARAAEEIETYVASITLSENGSLAVAADLTFTQAPGTFQQVIATTREAGDGLFYRFTVTEVQVSVDGAAVTPTVVTTQESTTISFATAGATQATLSYTVAGAAAAVADDQVDVVWDVAQGLSVPVVTVEATVSAETLATPSMIDCAAGAPASPGACTMFGGGTHDYPEPFFQQEGLKAGELFRVTLRYPSDAVAANAVVEERWSLDRAFRPGPAQVGSALALLLLGGLLLWLAHRRVGRDAAGAATPTLVAEFHPVAAGRSEFQVHDDVRPGLVGTLLDERVDPVDVTATLLDLAIRGYLRIEELPRAEHELSDWSFSRLKEDDSDLHPYEHTLLDAVAPHGGTPVRVSELGPAMAGVIAQVQSELYDEMVTRGWFARRPDTTRNSWSVVGWAAVGLALLATVLLAAFTTFGLLGLALLALSIGVLVVAEEMPARTASGSAALAGLGALRSSLLS